MVCDPRTLASESKCFLPLGMRQLIAYWAWSVCENGVAPVGDYRITEEGDLRITEEGDRRIIE